ncbi:MAG TPA: MFS transporter [Blastocatellia bacterium]|nr:MFS transporter [Blastocatellia bacterium]
MHRVKAEPKPEPSSRTTLLSRISLPLLRSLASVILGSLILRLASQTTGQMLQFYLERIDSHHYTLRLEVRGFITASFFVAELLGSLAFGALSDRYGRKLFILLGPILGAIAVQLTSMTVVVWLLVLTRLLEGLSTASSVPATLGYISEATVGRPNLRARVVGMFELTLVGGIAMGASVAGYLWKYFHHPTTFLGLKLISPAFSLNSLIYLASLAVFLWGLKDLKRRPSVAGQGEKANFEHYKRFLKHRSVWTFIPAWLSIFSIVGIWSNSSAALFTGSTHYGLQSLTGRISEESFGNGFAALAIFFAVGVLVWSLVLGRYRKTSVMLVATFALFAVLFTVFALNHLSTFRGVVYILLLGSLLIEVLVLSGFTPAALTYLADVTELFKQDRGSTMGLYSVFLGVGQLLGTTLGGYFAEWNGIDGLLLLSALFGAVTAISLLFVRRSEVIVRRSEARPPSQELSGEPLEANS